MRQSIRARLVGLFAVTLALVLVVIGALVLGQFRSERDKAIDSELRTRIDAVVGAGPNATAAALVDLLGTTDERFGQVLDATGRAVAWSRSLSARPVVEHAKPGLQTTSVNTRTERRHVRILTASAGGRTILIATALDDRDDAIRNLAVLLWVGGGGTLAAAGLLAWILAGAALRPVETMRAQAASYSTSDGGRLIVPKADDELHRLAETLNNMLDRIQSRFDEQKTFIDSASHELRTPLSNLTLELELALRHPRSPSELRAALESASQEAHRLNRLASDLLLLSNASSPHAISKIPTDLVALVRDTSATFGARAEAAGLTLVDNLVMIPPLPVDPTGIRQALTNLLDNAVRVTPAGGTVTTVLNATSSTVTLAVHDTGPGFPPELRPHAFDLFTHGTGTSGPQPGSGLGLGIVAAIATAHGGHARIEDQCPETVVSIVLPRA